MARVPASASIEVCRPFNSHVAETRDIHTCFRLLATCLFLTPVSILKERARILADFIEEKLPGREVNLIGHSMYDLRFWSMALILLTLWG